jgi:hypothetical protein
MGLGDVFERIRLELADDAIRFVGPDRKDDNSNHARVTWDPKRGQLAPAERAGGGPGDDGDIAVRGWVVEIVFWAKNFEALETLVDRFYAAAHDVGTHFSMPPNAAEAWSLGGVNANGATCTGLFQVKVGVRRTVMPVIQIESFVETPKIITGQ